MNDDTLVDLDAAEATNAAAKAEERYATFSPDDVWDELVLLAGLLLKDYNSFFSVGAITEYNNERAMEILPFFCPTYSTTVVNAYLRLGKYWSSAFLPDVCRACFRSFGLTIGGRLRSGCCECKGEDDKLGFERSMALHRRCPSNVGGYILAQLIYKYYSSNGNPLWEMKRTTNLL